jgi:sugar lactone lactonase YvrE
MIIGKGKQARLLDDEYDVALLSTMIALNRLNDCNCNPLPALDDILITNNGKLLWSEQSGGKLTASYHYHYSQHKASQW